MARLDAAYRTTQAGSCLRRNDGSGRTAFRHEQADSASGKLPVNLVRYHRPVSGIFSRRIAHDALGGIAIDQRPQVEGMLHAADFVLNSKQYLAAVRIDDVLESILMLIALLND